MTESQNSLTRMLVATINSKEVESNRVSRLLHDDVGQVLSAVGLQLDVMKLDFKERLPEIVGRINEIQELLEQAVRQVRAISYDLNPAVVERAGLQMALDRLVGRFREEYGGALRYMFEAPARPPTAVANVWYKIAELAIDNSIRHAGASRIEVQVKRTSKGLMLEIRDNGSGFIKDQPGAIPGLGLLLMEHYARQAPVTFDLESSPGKGTIVRSIIRDER